MKYVYAEDVIGTTSTLGGCRSCGGTRSLRGLAGASAPYSAAVAKIQVALRALAEKLGNTDYHPGPADGLYGQNTHAAIIRVARDFLEPAGLATSECRSTCNTLWTRAKAACGDCLTSYLTNISEAMAAALAGGAGVVAEDEPVIDEVVDTVPVSLGGFGVTDTSGVVLSPVEIAEIVGSYKTFLDAYVVEYGDGGQLDPQQIMRREEVDRETAERLAAERRAAAALAVTAEGTLTPDQPQIQKAGFSGWWILLVVGLGGAAWYAYDQSKKSEKHGGQRMLPPGRGERVVIPRRLPSHAGLKGGCGCGG